MTNFSIGVFGLYSQKKPLKCVTLRLEALRVRRIDELD
jgi:hypothetical protein